jgi:hypothetical protein
MEIYKAAFGDLTQPATKRRSGNFSIADGQLALCSEPVIHTMQADYLDQRLLCSESSQSGKSRHRHLQGQAAD